MKKPWTNVASFEDSDASRIFQAYLFRRKLESRIWDNRPLRVLLFLRPPAPVFHVQVPGNFEHFAAELAEKNPLEVLDQAIHCPQCSSLQIDYPCFSRNSWFAKATLPLSLLLRRADYECHCLKCHWHWTLPRRGSPTIGEVHQPSPVR